MKKTIFISIISLFWLFTAQAQEHPEIIESGKGFWIQSAMNYQKDNGGCWDIPGSPEKIEQGANIQVWNIDEGKDRKFFLKTTEDFGVYQIIPADRNGTTMLDVAGGEENFKKNGANIATWRMNGRDWQKFKFVHLGNGEFKIYTLSDMVICLDGRNNANGTNVHIWEDHDGDWMTWYLIDPETKKAWIPEAQEPIFFTENNLSYTYQSHSLKFEGMVSNVDYSGNTINITIDGHESGRNPGTGQMVDEDKTINRKVYFKNGIYYQVSYDMGGGAQVDQMHPYTDDNNLQYMHIGNGVFKEKPSEKPDFFVENKDKTFQYKQSLAFVEGSEGTAVVKEIADNKIMLSITSTGRNPMNGEMETKTFDYEIQYENGKYFRGTQADYYEEGTIRKDQNGKEYLTLDGEQSSVKFSLE
jgi:hypothetical protein